VNAIPIRNLYVLLAFAARDVGLMTDEQIGACDFDDEHEVLARLLDACMRRIFQRGIDREYTELHLQGPEPRGALDIARTITQALHTRGQLAFQVDERLPDTASNRVLRAALRVLLSVPRLSGQLRVRIRRHAERLQAVTDISPSVALALRPNVPRGLPAYRPALQIARLSLANALPDEGERGDAWRSLFRDDARMADLFESFVRGFAKHVLVGRAHVCVRQYEWTVEGATEAGLSLLPRMQTDVFIDWHAGTPTIGECKFYRDPFVIHRRGGTMKLHAAHLYQVMAYLRAARQESEPPPAGLLVYATVGEAVWETMILDSYPLTIVSLDLTRPWPELRASLLRALETTSPDQRPGAARSLRDRADARKARVPA
jgi:5-methylcytosine-specific restriction enzyme subunit McrC